MRSMEELVVEGLEHIALGFFIGIADRTTSDKSLREKPTKARIKRKTGLNESLYVLIEAEEKSQGKSREDYKPATREHYESALGIVRNHFIDTGIINEPSEHRSLGAKARYAAHEALDFFNAEKINPLMLRYKAGVAYGVELLGDAFVLVTSGGKSFLTAIRQTPLQGIETLIGLGISKYTLKAYEIVAKTRDEKELDYQTSGLVREHKDVLIGAITTYDPNKYKGILIEAEQSSGPSGSGLMGEGKRVLSGAADIVTGAVETVKGAYSQRQQAKQAEKDAHQDRLDEVKRRLERH